MKWWLSGAALTCAALSLGGLLWVPPAPNLARAQDARGGARSITTTGLGTVRVRPDTVRVSFGVTSNAKQFADALGENEKKIKKIVGSLKAIKPDLLKLDTVEVRSAPMQVSTALTPRGDETHTVTHSYTVVAQGKEPEALIRAADFFQATAYANGANTGPAFPASASSASAPPGSASRVELYREDDTAARAAMEKAVEAALAHAKAVAGSASLKVGNVVTLTDQPGTPGAAGSGAPVPAGPSDATGEYPLTIAVSVTFSY